MMSVQLPVPPVWPLFGAMVVTSVVGAQPELAETFDPGWLIAMLLAAVAFFLQRADKANTQIHRERKAEIDRIQRDISGIKSDIAVIKSRLGRGDTKQHLERSVLPPRHDATGTQGSQS